MSRRIPFRELMAAPEASSDAVLPDAIGPKTSEADVPAERASPLAPSRRGRKALTVHVDLDTHVRLKVLAAREVTTLEALVSETLDLLFAKRTGETATDTEL